MAKPADANPMPAATPAGSVRIWETATDGYRRAFGAYHEAVTASG
ncbi:MULTISPECIES: hypothetical protein [Streptomyces]|uniref:SAM-dependent methyltransferase n=1 Tax=Streptomyces ehimensis TaxID=68195 RepID=A0ABV9BT16_9ACTN